mgnify:FL=1
MPYKLQHIPLLKILIPIVAGILAFDVFSISFTYLTISILLLFGVLLISHFTTHHSFSKKINIVITFLFLFVLGAWMIRSAKIENQSNHFSRYKADFAKGIIAAPLEEKENTYKTVLQIEQVIDSLGNAQSSSGKLLVYFKKDSCLQTVEIGDEILFQLKAKTVDAPSNLGQFDYANYLKHKSMYQQAYIPNGSWILLSKHKRYAVDRISNNIGMYVQSILKKYIPGKENFTLADGILLGHRADIDMELYNAFAYTGILHILSVSGLHVGIIYGMLLFFLSFIPDRNRKIKISKFIFIFCFIWIFTFVTGFSSACVRAAILFSLLNFGRLSKENVNNLNLLAGAALIQLLMNPNNLFDIGFQLSYLAMLGLFIFTNPIYSLFYSRFKIIDWTWKLWSASIAAQLFTVPLSIYYFGNFPTYFLLANIFAIPLSSVILWWSMALIPLSFVPVVAHWVGYLDALSIKIFIQFTYFFAHLPLGKLFNLYVTPLQLIVLLFSILLLAFFVIQRKAVYIFFCMSLWLSTILFSYAYNIQQWRKNEIILYSVPKNFVIGIQQKGYQLLLSKDSIQTKSFNFCIQNSHRIKRIKTYENKLLKDSKTPTNFYFQNNLAVIYNKRFYFLTHTNTRKTFAIPLDIDYLVLSDNCYLNIEQIKSNYKFQKIIVSSDNDNYHQKIYRKILQESKMPFHDLNEKAFIISL